MRTAMSPIKSTIIRSIVTILILIPTGYVLTILWGEIKPLDYVYAIGSFIFGFLIIFSPVYAHTH